jgi:hypothetical protein
VTGKWPAPHPRRLTSVSPATLESLLQCGLRVAFEQDAVFRRWRRPTERSALGVVAHGLVEDTWRNPKDWKSPADAEADLTQQWDTLIAEQAEILLASWAPARPPPPTHWPGYALTKVRLIRRLARQAVAGRARRSLRPGDAPATAPAYGETGLRLPLVEHALFDAATGLRGTPDRVEKVDGRLRVVDLKSGVHQHVVTDPQRRQLLLYAQLVKANLGRYPDELVVIDVSGREAQVAFNESAVADAVALAVRQRDRWNQAVDRAADLSVLARPAASSCGWCPFRIVCRSSWDQWQPEWHIPAAVSGVVIDTQMRPRGGELHLMQDLPTTTTGQGARVVGLSAEHLPSRGDHIVITDVDRLGTDAVRVRWSSRIRITGAS